MISQRNTPKHRLMNPKKNREGAKTQSKDKKTWVASSIRLSHGGTENTEDAQRILRVASVFSLPLWLKGCFSSRLCAFAVFLSGIP